MAAKTRKQSAKPEEGRGPWSTNEVADITGVPRVTIGRWIENNTIRAPKQNPRSREYQWTQADIDELVRYAKQQQKETI